MSLVASRTTTVPVDDDAGVSDVGVGVVVVDVDAATVVFAVAVAVCDERFVDAVEVLCALSADAPWLLKRIAAPIAIAPNPMMPLAMRMGTTVLRLGGRGIASSTTAGGPGVIKAVAAAGGGVGVMISVPPRRDAG